MFILGSDQSTVLNVVNKFKIQASSKSVDKLISKTTYSEKMVNNQGEEDVQHKVVHHLVVDYIQW